MHLFEKLSITYCGKEEKQMASAVGRPLLCPVHLDTDAQGCEAENQVKKLVEELRIEKDM